MIWQHYLKDVTTEFRKYKTLGEKAMAQVTDDEFFRTLDDESNSIALIVKHMVGNMRSRWTDFLTTDGEKPDRHRDSEFISEAQDSRASLMQRWEEGWALLFRAIVLLQNEDATRTVYIRGEPHTVLEATNRQLTHYAYHVGQIVFLGRHFAGHKWHSLSIPKGKSAELEVSKAGDRRRMNNSDFTT